MYEKGFYEHYAPGIVAVDAVDGCGWLCGQCV